MEAGQGTLIRKLDRSFAIRYTAHGTEFGRHPSYFEIHELLTPLDPDELVTIMCADGRQFACRVLDHTNVCAVVAALGTSGERQI